MALEMGKKMLKYLKKLRKMFIFYFWRIMKKNDQFSYKLFYAISFLICSNFFNVQVMAMSATAQNGNQHFVICLDDDNGNILNFILNELIKWLEAQDPTEFKKVKVIDTLKKHRKKNSILKVQILKRQDNGNIDITLAKLEALILDYLFTFFTQNFSKFPGFSQKICNLLTQKKDVVKQKEYLKLIDDYEKRLQILEKENKILVQENNQLKVGQAVSSQFIPKPQAPAYIQPPPMPQDFPMLPNQQILDSAPTLPEEHMQVQTEQIDKQRQSTDQLQKVKQQPKTSHQKPNLTKQEQQEATDEYDGDLDDDYVEDDAEQNEQVPPQRSQNKNVSHQKSQNKLQQKRTEKQQAGQLKSKCQPDIERLKKFNLRSDSISESVILLRKIGYQLNFDEIARNKNKEGFINGSLHSWLSDFARDDLIKKDYDKIFNKMKKNGFLIEI